MGLHKELLAMKEASLIHPNKHRNVDFLNQIIKIQSKLSESDVDVDSFMNLVVQQMEKLTPATGVVIELVEGDDMVYKAATGTVASHLGLHLPQSGSISGLCVKAKEILRSDDTETDARVNLAACRLVHARSMVVAPLFYNSEAVGVIKILSDKPHGFDEEDAQTLNLMAGLIGSALAQRMSYETNQRLLIEKNNTLNELKKAEDQLKHMAYYDYLTDLPNRSLFIDRLTIAMSRSDRSKKPFSILFLDIDHFKGINDTYGHAVGDEVLKIFSLRVKQCIRSSDTVARLGGDEFVILLEEMESENDAITVAKKIIEIMNKPFKLAKMKLDVNTSIGITVSVDKKVSQEDLIKQADQALYVAKEAGRNQYVLFNSDG